MLLVGAYCRGQLITHASVSAPKDKPIDVELKPDQAVGGVYRVTVFEELPAPSPQPLSPKENGRSEVVRVVPLAERLIYRQPAQQLNLAIQPDKKTYIPGGSVGLSVTAKDENGSPAPAIMLLAVVDKRVITLADEKTFRGMPTHFYLTSEVRRAEDLEYADFLVGPHPQAKDALDLLLGTQGWRRFAEQEPTKFQQKYLADARMQADASRLMVLNGQSSRETIDLLEQRRQQMTRDKNAQFLQANDELAKAREAESSIQAGESFRIEFGEAHARAALAQQRFRIAEERVSSVQADESFHKEYKEAQAERPPGSTPVQNGRRSAGSLSDQGCAHAGACPAPGRADRPGGRIAHSAAHLGAVACIADRIDHGDSYRGLLPEAGTHLPGLLCSE